MLPLKGAECHSAAVLAIFDPVQQPLRDVLSNPSNCIAVSVHGSPSSILDSVSREKRLQCRPRPPRAPAKSCETPADFRDVLI